MITDKWFGFCDIALARRSLGLTNVKVKTRTLRTEWCGTRHCPLAYKNACYLNLRNWSYCHGSFEMKGLKE
jgi:hypothetical protein